jgi:tRNA dimethylallyltransferase
LKLLALFGPTAIGKTGVAIAVADLLRERGEDPVAVNCDSIQVYRGLETLSGAATEAEQKRLEHRLLSFVDPSEEFSAGRYAEAAHTEIDSLLEEGGRSIVVGGTGLYLRAALSDLDLRPPVPDEIRDEVELEIAERGSAALHSELDTELAELTHPNDRKRVARLTELTRAGIQPAPSAEGLWTTELRHPTTLVGLTMARGILGERIDARVDEMVAQGAADEARRAAAAGASRTARAALGFEQLIAGDPVGMKRAHRAYARRQITWMRRMEGVEVIDRLDMDDSEVAERVVEKLDEAETAAASGKGLRQ